MITAWILYSLVLGAMLAVGALLADRAAVAARLPRRFAWMGTLTLLIVLTALAPWRQATRITGGSTMKPTAISATDPVRTPGTRSTIERIVDALAYAARHGIDDVSAGVPVSVDRTIGALWLIASAVSLLTLLSALRRLDRQRREWPLATMYGERVRVTTAHGPAVYGVLRPEIVLPNALLARPSNEQQLVLAHEAEHRRARDPLLLSAAALAAALIPWHPIAWWLASRLRSAIELDCDARVLRRGASPRQYGELLIALSEALPSRRNSLHALALLDSPRLLEERLLAMTAPASRRVPLAIGSLLLGGAAVVVAACNTDVPSAARVRDADATTVAYLLGLPDGSSVTYVVDGRSVSEAEAKRVKAGEIATINVHTDAGVLSLPKKGLERGVEVRIITRRSAAAPDTIRAQNSMSSVLPTTDSEARVLSGADTGRVMLQFMRDDSSNIVVRQRSLGTSDLSSEIVVRVDSQYPTPARVTELHYASAAGEPLLVLDGVIAEAGISALRNLIPTDIASIEVVKGASAERVYGSQAASGVIQVSTKRLR